MRTVNFRRDPENRPPKIGEMKVSPAANRKLNARQNESLFYAAMNPGRPHIESFAWVTPSTVVDRSVRQAARRIGQRLLRKEEPAAR
jgi:hypothetical protein